MKLLTQNSELRPHNIHNWSIPAWYVRRADGKIFKTCPSAGSCAQVCYARNGTYLFRNVLEAHTRNLNFVLERPEEWVEAIAQELAGKKFRPTGIERVMPAGTSIHLLDPWLRKWIHNGGAAVRIHDSGDFFADWYLMLWLAIARAFPEILFYAYTKEIVMFKDVGAFPVNFRYLFSTGGIHDYLITADDRHADVFPSHEALIEAGYESQEANDLLAILLPTNYVGIVANNIPHFNKKMAGKRFSEL